MQQLSMITKIYDTVLLNSRDAWKDFLRILIEDFEFSSGSIALFDESIDSFDIKAFYGSCDDVNHRELVSVAKREAKTVEDLLSRNGVHVHKDTETGRIRLYAKLGSENRMLVTLVRHDGDRRDISFDSDVLRHCVRAASILETLQSPDPCGDDIASLFDGARFAAFRIHKSGEIIWSNRIARTYVGDGKFAIVQNKLACASKDANDMLSVAIKEAKGRCFALKTTDRTSMMVKVHPLAPRGVGMPGTCALLARDPHVLALPGIKLLRDLHGFTHAEAQLALALASGETTNDYATRCNYSLSYIRKLSSRTLSRVDAKTRGELIQRVINSNF